MKMLTQKGRLLCAVVAVMVCCCTSWVQAQGNNSVTICHDGHTISVNINALGQHLLHGDVLGPCCIDPRLINPSCVCPAVYAPVCGCNGVTYSNSCLARCSGVTTWTNGPCTVSCQGPPLNIFCTTQYDPVCGCDGNTYSNACFAMAAGIFIFTPGACGSIGKRADEVQEPASLAPNPTNGIAVLKWTPLTDGQATVTVIDMVGKVVFQSESITEVAGGMNTYPIQASDWESGIYIVRLSSGGTVTSQKLMVTH